MKINKIINRLCKIGINASYTVENAVIMPLFVIIITSVILFAFYLHDSVILKCAALKVVINLKSELIAEDGNEYIISQTDKTETSATEYLREKTLLLKGVDAAAEIRKGVSDKKIKVMCKGTIKALPLFSYSNVQIVKNVETDATGPGDLIRKCRAAEALYKSYISEREGK